MNTAENLLTSDHYPILPFVFSNLSAKQLCIASQVCSTWNKEAQRELDRRRTWNGRLFDDDIVCINYRCFNFFYQSINICISGIRKKTRISSQIYFVIVSFCFDFHGLDVDSGKVIAYFENIFRKLFYNCFIQKYHNFIGNFLTFFLKKKL